MRRKIRFSFSETGVPRPGGGRPAGTGGEEVLSVGELTRGIRRILESTFPDVAVRGEVTGSSRPRSGHLYFTLRDGAADASIAVVLWREAAARLRFRVEDGIRVVVRGRLGVYEPRGSYQVIAETVEAEGAGELALAFERLKSRLAAEGLFDPARKRPLPFLPRTIGVVTSPAGAAISDILRSILRRHPGAHVRIAPARVQGEGSAEDVIGALEILAGPGGGADVIIIGRGGGSPEDLWTFNEERVVRAVAASPVPTISAVGHEIDFTLCDFAADVRAQTPTHAGEIVVPDTMKLFRFLEENGRRLDTACKRIAGRCAERLNYVSRALSRSSPEASLARRLQRLDELAESLGKNLYSTYLRWQDKLRVFSGRLTALDPLAVLRRGYSVVLKEEGSVVRRASELQPGAAVRILLQEGKARATIREIEKDHGE